MTEPCLFCTIVDGDVPSVRVAETDATYAFGDINPASDGVSLLVIPTRHNRDLPDISPDDGVEGWQPDVPGDPTRRLAAHL